uniref:Uncharacterized protein n=1 Tax=candidate division WOR-3 bacterium TaxID=2052148 RepID=A0A7C4CD27_UNCW3
MSTRVRVAVLRTSPETVLDDCRRLLRLADADKHLKPGVYFFVCRAGRRQTLACPVVLARQPSPPGRSDQSDCNRDA